MTSCFPNNSDDAVIDAKVARSVSFNDVVDIQEEVIELPQCDYEQQLTREEEDEQDTQRKHSEANKFMGACYAAEAEWNAVIEENTALKSKFTKLVNQNAYLKCEVSKLAKAKGDLEKEREVARMELEVLNVENYTLKKSNDYNAKKIEEANASLNNHSWLCGADSLMAY